MKQPKIVRELPCDMTDEERLLKADQLAKHIDKLQAELGFSEPASTEGGSH